MAIAQSSQLWQQSKQYSFCRYTFRFINIAINYVPEEICHTAESTTSLASAGLLYGAGPANSGV